MAKFDFVGAAFPVAKAGSDCFARPHEPRVRSAPVPPVNLRRRRRPRRLHPVPPRLTRMEKDITEHDAPEVARARRNTTLEQEVAARTAASTNELRGRTAQKAGRPPSHETASEGTE